MEPIIVGIDPAALSSREAWSCVPLSRDGRRGSYAVECSLSEARDIILRAQERSGRQDVLVSLYTGAGEWQEHSLRSMYVKFSELAKLARSLGAVPFMLSCGHKRCYTREKKWIARALELVLDPDAPKPVTGLAAELEKS